MLKEKINKASLSNDAIEIFNIAVGDEIYTLIDGEYILTTYGKILSDNTDYLHGMEGHILIEEIIK